MKNNYEEQPLSKCCEAPLMTSTGDEGTMCYICRKCNKPSDPKQKKCECCKHELCHFFCGECHNMSCPAFVRPHNKCYDGLMKSIPTESTVTQITIAPSERIDYCSTCKEDHGYECPKDPSPTKSTGKGFTDEARKIGLEHASKTFDKLVDIVMSHSSSTESTDECNHFQMTISPTEKYCSGCGMHWPIKDKLSQK